MASSKGSKLSYTLYFSFATIGLIIAVLGFLFPDLYDSTTGRVGLNLTIPKSIRKYLSSPSHADHHQYRAQVFSRDPLVMYIHDFLTPEEIDYVLEYSEPLYEPSKVYGGIDNPPITDEKMRRSEQVIMDRKDPIARRLAQRAREFQGWRGNTTYVQPLSVQRYNVSGFYNYHFDPDGYITKGNRVTSFMIYLTDDCTGGGTNFPFLPQPNDTRWCNVIECDEEAKDGFQGTTFKPVKGSAVFWENFYPNGSWHHGVYHASLPVKSGVKGWVEYMVLGFSLGGSRGGACRHDFMKIIDLATDREEICI